MKKVIIAALAIFPAVAFAQDNSSPSLGNLSTLLESIGNLVETALPILIAVALLVFFWGLVKPIWGGAEAVAEGKNLMIWGVIALFVMVSVWGLVRFLGSATGVKQGGTVTTPTVQGI